MKWYIHNFNNNRSIKDNMNIIISLILHYTINLWIWFNNLDLLWEVYYYSWGKWFSKKLMTRRGHKRENRFLCFKVYRPNKMQEWRLEVANPHNTSIWKLHYPSFASHKFTCDDIKSIVVTVDLFEFHRIGLSVDIVQSKHFGWGDFYVLLSLVWLSTM